MKEEEANQNDLEDRSYVSCSKVKLPEISIETLLEFDFFNFLIEHVSDNQGSDITDVFEIVFKEVLRVGLLTFV